MRLTILAMIALVFATSGGAQTDAPLRVGTLIRVSGPGMPRDELRFVALTPDTLRVAHSRRVIAIPTADIVRLRARTESRRVLTGLVLGLAGGAVLGMAGARGEVRVDTPSSSTHTAYFDPVLFGAITLAGGAVGGTIGERMAWRTLQLR